MALFSNLTITFTTFFLFFSLSFQQQPPLNSTEQQALYQLLHSLNPSIPWRSLYPDDLCLSAPHGVVCDYPLTNNQTLHIVELSFGHVSDETPNPPCSPNATFNPSLFFSFKYLQKLFFYKCFNHTLSLSSSSDFALPNTLEELVFIDNPSFVAPLGGFLRNLSSLRRLVLIGNGFYGEVPLEIGDLVNLEELTISRNQLGGEVPASLGLVKKMKVLDLSQNKFEGCVPESFGNLNQLLKLDLSSNGFACKIPESLKGLKSLELLDFSFNRFGDFGVPLFIGEIPTLTEVYLSGNLLSGVIPEIWENLGGMKKIGFSNMGLDGKIPHSMGVYLKNLSYLGLDNNNLEGPVPEEFGLLQFIDEINLENNNLSGRVPFISAKDGQKMKKLKLKLAGNRGLCLDNNFVCNGNGSYLVQLNPCKKTDVPGAVLFNGISVVLFDPLMLVLVFLMELLFVF